MSVEDTGNTQLKEFYELEKIGLIRTMFEGLDEGKQIILTNAKGGLKGFIPMLAFEKTGKSVLYVTGTDKEARDQQQVFSRFENLKSCYFPREDFTTYLSEAHSRDKQVLRNRTIETILSGEPAIVVASMDALLKKLKPLESVEEDQLTVKTGEESGLENLTGRLVELGYVKEYQTESNGQFSVRGDIVDIFPMASPTAYRVEFFDDEIDSIRKLDVATQRSSDHLDALTIGPVSEMKLSGKEREKAREKMLSKMKETPGKETLLEKMMVDESAYDELLAGFAGSHESLVGYMRAMEPDLTVVWDDPTTGKINAETYLELSRKEFENYARSNEISSFDLEKFFNVGRIEKELKKGRVVLEYLFGTRMKTGEIIDMDSRAIESFAGQPKIFEEFIKNRVRDDYYVHFFCVDKDGEARIRNYLDGIGVTGIVTEADEHDQPGIRISIGEITEGFELAKEKIVFINESEVFRPEKKRRRKKNPNAKKIDRFTDLHVGDFVVHDVHGIGVYKGIEQLEIDGVTKDLMRIEYKDDASLYIPVEQMDAIQVYIGTGEASPKISKLGGTEWKKAKNKAYKAVEEMADELIALYAKRRELKGYAFGPDTPWQKDFEDAFPYTETEDQLRSAEEIKKDMESPLPMDRLLCGDVGYGKTEVAFRAAFKAAMDGKQTAMLVPTTVLAQQHYHSALERFKDFPVTIAELSRFKTPQEQKQILKDIENGKVDIVIGTHRLLSKDVKFKDIGLLIIDEEQRFGVKSKEKIKKLKENIDVLTLSATPIPRTLHMSLSGVRDMSVLEEPPAERLPVETFVMPYSPYIAVEAIEREIDRGGQVYFIHNQIYDIEKLRDDLSRLLPGVRIALAHGQMSAKELEHIMDAFLAKEYDVLLATTIVESGLDVRNANTLIVHNADRFGLAQLYQLRGRVGRSEKQAYAYITTPQNKIISSDAEKRLKAIRDFTAFGSGFKIAMRDLEIRGAGNLLGAQQSGHLAKIGYELYTRILDQAVKERMTGERPREIQPVRIQIPISAYIPDYYVGDEETKFDLYSRLTYITDQKDYDAFEDELIDRFGEIPQSVYNLMVTAMIKNAANRLGITEILQKPDGRMILEFSTPDLIKASPMDIARALPEKWDLQLGGGTPEKPVFSFKADMRGYNLLKKLYDFLVLLETTPKAA